MNLGISGALTKGTIRSPLTPLFLLTWVRIGFQYWAVSETVRWCRT